jgi:hypothetical protein
MIGNNQSEGNTNGPQDAYDKQGVILLQEKERNAQQFKQDRIHKPKNCHGMIVFPDVLYFRGLYAGEKTDRCS